MKILPLLLGAAVATAGCAVVGPSSDECPNPPVTPITIKFVKNNVIKVDPSNAEPDRGNVLRFILVGDKDTVVTVAGKDSESSWISGSNSGDPIHVCVKKNLVKGKTYRYAVTVDGVGILDPEVTVRN